MKNILILGAGTAGSMMANKLFRALDKKEWKITVVDPSSTHYYQPGFLFIPFGKYSKEDVIKPAAQLIPKGVEFISAEVQLLQAAENKVILTDGRSFAYDYLIIATGARIAPEETPGILGPLWQKDVFEFYTLEGALALAERLKNFNAGKLVVSIVDMPFKCPVAPIEFVCLADDYFKRRGIREKVEIFYVTPLSGAFTKPIAAKMLSQVMQERNIQIISDFYIERVDNENKKLVSYDEREVPFDLLTIVPLNKGADFVGRSGIGDELNFIPVDKHTLQMSHYPNVFVLGDAAAIPTSKAGSVAHFAGEILFENIMHIIQGETPKEKFDGHSNCYIEVGGGKASLIDFNYDTEPLPGTYPVPGVGPFKLLSLTRINHWGKLAFRWIYWNLLVKGRTLPVSAHMSMKGKKIIS
ncbi:MAG: NAD(P)/FAD-dependent oxidoreductase [Bacteroidales bacterium]|nr:NAD(P)/FAD-dependent oxidoreductase [Bacteroidales bacterium]